MATYRLPLLVWRDAQSGYTAAPVELYLGQPDMVGFSEKLSTAIKQVQSYLTWFLKECPWNVPDFQDPRLTHLRVDIRPEYRTAHRVYPCPEQIEIQIPCVLGRQESGLLLCSMPTLGLIFHYFDDQELPKLVAEAVRQKLAGNSPQELSQFLPPRSIQLEMVSIRAPHVSFRTDDEPLCPTLLHVAQAIGKPDFRKRFGHVWKREQEVRDLARRLGGEQANVLLVGDRGSGKTSVLVHAVRAVERERSKTSDGERPARYRFWQTSAGRLVAGMKYLGQWEERCEQIISELSSIDGVLCLESLMELTHIGGAGAGSSVAAFLASYVRDGQLRMMAEATAEEVEASRRLLPGFAELFQVLRLEDLTEPDMREALRLAVDQRAREGKVEVEEFLADRLFQLFHRFMPYHPLPGGAAGFLKNLFDRARTERMEQLSVATALAQFKRETGLPESFLRDDHALDVQALEARFREQVIGQPEACRVVADVIARFKTGLNDPHRPLGVLLFCGPTGVGKTQLAKTVSRYLFGHGEMTDRLVRLDMSEYSSPYAAERLISKSDGTPSDFVSRVRQQPFAVVLLDEIEKAAAEVYDVLLGVLDEGRLTDRFGRTTTFCNTIVIMTSNLGAASRRSIGLRPRSGHHYEAEVRAFFRPEFFNRLDQLVAFRPLPKEACLAIIRKELNDVEQREGFRKLGLRLRFDDAVIERLLKVGFHPHFGARPLQRVIEESVVATLARFIVDNAHIRNATVRLELGPQNDYRVRAD
ncbi:MAG: AAA family ATPase [Planctomycetota bacterium]